MARKMATVTESGTVEIDRGGGVIRGSYTVAGGMLTVSDMTGSKTAHLGGLPAATLARLLLGELLRDEEARLTRRG